jgi:hypothetical protein
MRTEDISFGSRTSQNMYGDCDISRNYIDSHCVQAFGSLNEMTWVSWEDGLIMGRQYEDLEMARN